MKNKFLIPILGVTFLGTLTSWSQDGPMRLDRSYFSSEEFKKSFVGSYGVLAEVEPEVSEDESKLLTGLIDLIAQNPSAAVAQLQSSMTEASSAALYFVVGSIYYQMDQMEAAQRAYATATKKHPSFRRAWKNLGLIHFQATRYPEAIEALKKSIELGDQSGQSFGLLAVSYMNSENYMAAESAFRRAFVLEHDTKQWKLGLLRALMAMERFGEANSMLTELIAKDPNSAELWQNQARCLVELNQMEDAVTSFEVVRLMGKAPASILSLMGNLYMDLEKSDAALNAYLAALDASEQLDPLAVIQTAGLLFSRGNVDQADQYVKQVKARLAELTPDAKFDLMTLEAKVARAQGRDGEAAGLLQEIIFADNRNGEARIELALYFEEQAKMVEGDTPEMELKREELFSKARLYFEQAQMIPDSEVLARQRYGQMLVNRGKYTAALPMLRKVLELNPNDRFEEYVRRVERAARRQEAKEEADKSNIAAGKSESQR